MHRVPSLAIVVLAATLCRVVMVWAQGSDVFRLPRDHAAIEYTTRATRNAIVRLNERIEKGELQLTFGRPRAATCHRS